MAKKAVYLPKPDDIDDVFDVDAESTTEQRERETIENIVEELAQEQESYIKIHRIQHGINSQHEYLFTVLSREKTVTELFDHIRDKYGPGKYRLMFYNPHLPHSNGLVTSKIITIGAPITETKAPENNIESLLDFFREQEIRRQEEMRTILLRMEEQKSKPGFLDKLVAMEPDKLIITLTGLVGLVKPLLPQQPKDPLEQLIKLRQFGDDFGLFDNAEPEEEPSWLSALRELAPILQTAIKSQPKALKAPVTPKPEQAPQMDKNTQVLKARILQIIELIKKGKTPEDVFILVDNMASDDEFDAIAEFLEPDNVFQMIVRIAPEAQPYGEWFASFRELILIDTGDAPEVVKAEESNNASV